MENMGTYYKITNKIFKDSVIIYVDDDSDIIYEKYFINKDNKLFKSSLSMVSPYSPDKDSFNKLINDNGNIEVQKLTDEDLFEIVL